MRDDSFWSIVSEVIFNPILIALLVVLGYALFRFWMDERSRKIDPRAQGKIKGPEDNRTKYWRKKFGLPTSRKRK